MGGLPLKGSVELATSSRGTMMSPPSDTATIDGESKTTVMIQTY